MNLIAAVDKNWAIGKDNKLLVQIPMDMKFVAVTLQVYMITYIFLPEHIL